MMTRRPLSVALVALVLLVSGAASAQTMAVDLLDPAVLAALRVKANAGSVDAQVALAGSYVNGKGVPQDYVQAVAWYQLAAAQGHAASQGMLGVFYWNGQGIKQDYEQAAIWMRASADQGITLSQYMLGSAYEQGKGVPQDYAEAHKWLNLAAARGDAEFTTARDRVANLMTPAQIAEAQTLAREWQAAFEERGGVGTTGANGGAGNTITDPSVAAQPPSARPAPSAPPATRGCRLSGEPPQMTRTGAFRSFDRRTCTLIIADSDGRTYMVQVDGQTRLLSEVANPTLDSYLHSNFSNHPWSRGEMLTIDVTGGAGNTIR